VRNGALDVAADDMAAAVGPGTLIVPFLNGIEHMDRLSERFGRPAVLGGVVLAIRQLGERGEIISLMPAAKLTIGAQPGPEQRRARLRGQLHPEGLDADRVAVPRCARRSSHRVRLRTG